MPRNVGLMVSSADPALRGQLAASMNGRAVEFAQGPTDVERKLLGNVVPRALVWDLRWDAAPDKRVIDTISKVCPQIPVIVLAWNSPQSAGRRPLRAGNVQVVRGPLSLASLRTLVKRVWDSRLTAARGRSLRRHAGANAVVSD